LELRIFVDSLFWLAACAGTGVMACLYTPQVPLPARVLYQADDSLVRDGSHTTAKKKYDWLFSSAELWSLFGT
jgi:hypothetical protein